MISIAGVCEATDKTTGGATKDGDVEEEDDTCTGLFERVVEEDKAKGDIEEEEDDAAFAGLAAAMMVAAVVEVVVEGEEGRGASSLCTTQ